MRLAALLAGLVLLAAADVAAAQGRPPGGGGGSHSGSQGSGSQSGSTTPPLPPLPRCADLGIASYAFVTAVPGGEPLAADEIAIQWDVHNGGNAGYSASGPQAQSLTLEYATPSGVHQVATMNIPASATGTAPAAAAPVNLAAGQSWRGYMRTALPAAARRWQLRLKLTFAAATSIYAAPVSDCDAGNNEIQLARLP